MDTLVAYHVRYSLKGSMGHQTTVLIYASEEDTNEATRSKVEEALVAREPRYNPDSNWCNISEMIEKTFSEVNIGNISVSDFFTLMYSGVDW
jgi:hypothetical protein